MTVIRCDACGKEISDGYYYECKLNYTESNWAFMSLDKKDSYDICMDCMTFLLSRPKLD